MKRIAVSAVTLLMVVAGVAQNKSKTTKPTTSSQTSSTALTLKTGLDSFSYAMGMSVGKFYKQQGLTSIKTNLMLKGIGDAMNDKSKPVMDEMQCNMVMQSYLTEQKAKKSNASKMAGQRFLDSIAKQPGVVKLPSGLQYSVLKEGTGPKPTINDTVRCHYHGTLIDGTVFDSSVDRGQPAESPVGGVIKGWVEALPLMPVGSKWKLFIPADLAYGNYSPPGSKIGAGSTLIFEVELLDIVNKKQ